jgi:hypothetical protein
MAVYGVATYGAGTYGVSADVTAPVVTFTGQDRTIISRVALRDAVVATFTVDENFSGYEIRLVPDGASPRGSGTLVESGAGGTSGATITVTITDDELVAAGGANGNNVLKVFVQDIAGNWSA